MKRVLSLLLAAVLAFASLGAGTAVFATDTLTDTVEEKIDGAAAYVAQNTPDISALSAVDFLTLQRSGYDMSAYKTAFLKNTKANLDKNGGKLIYESTSWYQDGEGNWQSYSVSYEDIGLYGATILVMENYGINPSSFEGYNITKSFEKVDVKNGDFNPYNYRVAVEAAAKDSFKKTLCDDLIQKFYVKGSGLNYYGFSCDNTASFLTTVAPLKDTYADYVTDAKKVIKTFTKDTGCYADSVYVTDVNADSTAYAMMGYAAVGDIKNATKYYEMLTKNFESSTPGVFLSYGTPNYVSTRNALLALEYFYGAISQPKTVTLASTKYVYSGKAKKPAVTVKDTTGKVMDKKYYSVKYKNNKNVGTATATVTFKNGYSGSVTKTFKINPKRTVFKDVTAASKGFKASWKKMDAQVTGYQVQYSTDKNFKNKKTVTIAKKSTTAKTVKNLKAKKKYFVRIRTYKTVGDKKYYSGWSPVKTVTTKK